MTNDIEILKKMGLSVLESKIYIALINQLSLTINQIVTYAGISRTRCYKALERLETEGWISKNNSWPAKYFANDPEIVLSKKQDKLNSAISITKSTLRSKWEKRELHQTKQIEVVQGADYVVEKSIEMIKSAKNSIFLVIRFLAHKELYLLLRRLTMAKKDGKSVKVLMFTEVYNSLPQVEQKKLQNLGEVRIGPVPVRVIIIDGARIMMSFVPVVEGEMQISAAQSLYIYNLDFTRMLEQTMNITWNAFNPI